MKVLTLDIGGTAIKSALFDQGQIGKTKEFPSEGNLGKDALLENINRCISDYESFDCIGISTAGQVDHTVGVIIQANDNIPGYTGTRLKEILEARYHTPVFVENDVNAAALGELYYGSAAEETDFLCLTYGTGIGGAIVIDRRIYPGSSGISGEIGHILTHPEGELCTCGRKGCYERYASVTALVRKVSSIYPELTNGRLILEELKRQPVNSIIFHLADEWMDEVSYGLVTLVHIFNPSCIVLGGGIFSQPFLLAKIQEKVERRLIESFRTVRLKTASLGNQAGVYGMLAVISNRFAQK